MQPRTATRPRRRARRSERRRGERKAGLSLLRDFARAVLIARVPRAARRRDAATADAHHPRLERLHLVDQAHHGRGVPQAAVALGRAHARSRTARVLAERRRGREAERRAARRVAHEDTRALRVAARAVAAAVVATRRGRQRGGGGARRGASVAPSAIRRRC